MSHGENFREISHEKETHEQFHKIFHAHSQPPRPFFFLSQRLDVRGQDLKYFYLSCYWRENKPENRPQYALMP